MKHHILVLIFSIAILYPQMSEARPYSCGNGRVQQYPCHYSYVELSSGAVRDSNSACEERGGCFGGYGESPRARLADAQYSLVEDEERGKILEASLVEVQDGRGRWSGALQGEGRVYLYLDYLRGGDLIETRSMGSTDVRRDDGSVRFSFESTLPNESTLGGEKFDWKVRALVDRE